MAVNLILLLGFSLVGFSVGAPNCAKPCEDLWAAKSCNKVQYCINNDWSKAKPTGQTDDVCDICLRMVQEARTTLESNETQDALKQVLEGSCKLLLLKPAVELCDKLADEFVPELVAILASQMDPETVCSVAKLCNNDMLTALQKNSLACTGCQRFMAASKEKMKSVSEEEFREGLGALCRNTGSFSDACYSANAMYSSLLYNHTKAALNGSPCEATLLCPANSPPAGTEKPCSLTNLQKRMCPMCPRVTRDIVEQLTRVKSVEDYQEHFGKMCKGLGFPGDFCTTAAKSSRVYHFLKENGESFSRSFCSRTVCAGKRLEEVPVWPLLPLQHFTPSMEEVEEMILRTLVDFIREDREGLVAFDEGPDGSEEDACEESPLDCQTCKLTLKKISRVWEDEENKESVKDSLSFLCGKLPKGTKDRCLSVVGAHERDVTGVILGHSSPEEACARMSYCPRQEEPSAPRTISYGDLLEKPAFFSPVLPSAFYESDCRMCKELSQVLSNYVSANNSYINLDVACLMSKNIRECLNFLRSYSPDISRAFAEYVSSEKVCADVIPSCSARESFVAPKRESMDLCQTCRTWVDGVTSVLLDDKNMEMIRATFELVCDKLAGDAREQCRDAISQRSSEMLANILKLLSPDTACSNLNYCPAKRNDLDLSSASTSNASLEESSELDKVPCKFCLLAVKTLLDQLEDNRSKEAIEKALKSLCNYFPEETRDTCRNLVEQYAEDLIDMIIADFSPSEICIRLKICKPTSARDETPFVSTFDIRTNEIRDEPPQPLRTSGYDSSEEAADEAKLLKQVHSAVQECAMCEALVQVISTHKQMLVKDYDFAGNSAAICRIVPRRRRKQCASMVVSYGPSIVNLLVDKKVDPNEVCPVLTLCDPSMHAKVNLPVSVAEPEAVPARRECLQGPSFWCASEENAKKCGTYLHCREMVWKGQEAGKQ